MNHEELVRKLSKPGHQIIQDLDDNKASLWHMATGLSGESGEVLDCIKKHVIYGKDLDRENLVEELGDIEYFIEGIRQSTRISRKECIFHNISKLSKRYKNMSYSNEQAQARADKI